MNRPLKMQFSDSYYHITCRVNERKAVFIDGHYQEIFQKFFENVNKIALTPLPSLWLQYTQIVIKNFGILLCFKLHTGNLHC